MVTAPGVGNSSSGGDSPSLVLVRRLQARLRFLRVRRIAAALAGGDQVLARVSRHHELGGPRAAHRARVGVHLDGLQTAARENADVRLAVILERLVQPRPIQIERITVLHRELPNPQEPALRPQLVPELGLDLVPGLGKLPVAAQLVAGQRGEDLLVRHRQAENGALAVLQAEHVLAHHRPAARLLPDLTRVQRGQVELLPADRVHLRTNDLRDLEDGALPERQDGVDAGGELADVTGTDQELVRGHQRVRRHLLEGRGEGPGHSHACTRTDRRRRAGGYPFRFSSRSTVCLICSYGCAPLMNTPLMKKAGVPLTPAALPAFMSSSTSAFFSPLSRHLSNFEVSIPTDFAYPFRSSTASLPWLLNIFSCSSQNFPWSCAQAPASAAFWA